MTSARRRRNGAIRSAADRGPMGKDPALAAPTPPTPTGWTPSGRRPARAGGDLVDTAERGALAGFAGGVSLPLDLLAAAAGLGGARGLAEDLAGVPCRVE